jgi:hypothetical protein
MLAKRSPWPIKYNIWVLNEATTQIGNSDGQSHLEPALGLSWAQCVNSSFFVT